MSDLTLKSFADTLEDSIANARREGFRMGLIAASLPVLGGLVFMCAAQVWLSSRREEAVRRANIEAAACSVELANRRTAESAFRTCVNGTFAVHNEIANLVRSCR
jgi:hypothetical protein